MSMKINKTMRRVGMHSMPMGGMTPKKTVTAIPTKIGGMKPAIRKTSKAKIGYGSFPKGHVY